jgi:hypothetical protein
MAEEEKRREDKALDWINITCEEASDSVQWRTCMGLRSLPRF